jgi:hypothetical protein
VEDVPPLLVARFVDLAEVDALVDAALAERVVFVVLDEAPLSAGRHALVVHAPGLAEPVVLSATPAGEARSRCVALRLAPLDPASASKLRALRVTRLSTSPPPSRREARASTSPPPSFRRASDGLAGLVTENGRYELVAPIGEGAFGRAYRARHVGRDQPVALEIVRDARVCTADLVERRVLHPNVVRVLDHGAELEGMTYLITELVAGRTLREVLANDGRLSVRRAAELGAQVCAALAAAHDVGVVHGRLGLGDVIVVREQDDEGTARESVKVRGFGRARPGAAECAQPRDDVYACAALLYELTTGVAPAAREPAPVSAIVPRIEPRFEALLSKALSPSQDARFASARELRGELRRITGSGEFRPLLGSTLRELSNDEAAAEMILDANAVPDVSRPPPAPSAAPSTTSIAESDVGFAELLSAVTAAIARTTYYERAHPEFGRALAQLSSALARPLTGRGEITLARRDGYTSDLAVLTGAGEMMELARAVPGGVGASCAYRLGEVFVRRALVSLTFKEGVDDRELADAVELLSGPEISGADLQAQFVARRLTKVGILFVAEMLGRERRLPWQVMLCISRIARDLAAVPKMLQQADVEGRRRLRTALIGDVTRTLRTPEQVKLLLTSWDLIAAGLVDAETDDLDISAALVGSLAHPMLLRVASLILIDMERVATAPSSGAGSALPGANVRQLMHVIGSRFVRERTIESDDVLRELHSRAVLSFPELPEDVQLWVLAEQQAGALAKDPEPMLRVLDTVFDVPRYAREVTTLSRALRVLARRGEVAALWPIVVRLEQRHARGAAPGDETREGLAAGALASLADADVLTPVATVLLTGPGSLRDAAQGVLVAAGGAGARALCSVRAHGGEVVRARFVEAMRELGAASKKPLAGLLEWITGTAGGDADAALVEDVLRALPEIDDARVGMAAAALLRHRAPPVRRAAVGALSSPWGPQARAVLLNALEDADEGVVVAALTGLRRVGVIDRDTVRRVEHIFASGAPENTCAVAASLLGAVIPEARADAVEVLCAALQPKARGVVARVTGAPPTGKTSAFVIETIARALLAIGGERGRSMVEARAAKSTGVDKEILVSLLEPPREGAL